MFHSFYLPSRLLRQTVYLPSFHSRLKPDNVAAAGLCWVICWYFQIRAEQELPGLNLVLCKWHGSNIYSVVFAWSAMLPVPDVLFHARIIDDKQYVRFIPCSFPDWREREKKTPACVGQEDLAKGCATSGCIFIFPALLGWLNARACLLPSCEIPRFLRARKDFGVIFLETEPPDKWVNLSTYKTTILF